MEANRSAAERISRWAGCGYSVAETLPRPQEHPAHRQIQRAFSRAVSRFLEGLGSALGFTRRQYGHCILRGIRRTKCYGTSRERYSGLMPADLITLAHFSVSSAMSLPKSATEPGSTNEDDQRSYEGGHDISQRDRHSVQPWGKPQHPKQQATNEGSDKTHAQISEEAKAFTIPKWSSAQRGFLREARQQSSR